MKKVLVALFCLSLSTGLQVNAQSKTDDAKQNAAEGAKFKFTGGETYDFGKIKRGPGAKHTFEFTNVGNQPLIIMNVTPSCGCTNVDWSKNPVLPGQKGFVALELKTDEQHGVFNKEVYIQSTAKAPNGAKRYTINIKGNATDDAPESPDQKK